MRYTVYSGSPGSVNSSGIGYTDDIVSNSEITPVVGIPAWSTRRRYYVPGISVSNLSMTLSSPTSVDLLYAIPFRFSTPRTIDRLAACVSNPQPTCVGRFGLYTADSAANGYGPLALIAETGNLDLSTGSATVLKGDTVVNIPIAAGSWYWWVCVFGTAVTQTMVCINNVGSTLGAAMFGFPSVTGSYSATAPCCLAAPFPYAALPAAFPMTTGIELAAAVPALLVRFAA